MSIWNLLIAIPALVNNALQLPDRLKAALRSKWFVRVAIAFSFVAVAVVSWFAHDWAVSKIAPQAVALVSVPTPTLVSPPTTSATQPAVPKPQGLAQHPKTHHRPPTETRPSDHTKLSVGTESVVMGLVPDETRVRDRSVVLGATDANGNAIYTQPGAYGYGAQAGPGTIAIGAYAGAGMAQPAGQTQPTTTAPPQ
jgi:hypothetical protein